MRNQPVLVINNKNGNGNVFIAIIALMAVVVACYFGWQVIQYISEIVMLVIIGILLIANSYYLLFKKRSVNNKTIIERMVEGDLELPEEKRRFIHDNQTDRKKIFNFVATTMIVIALLNTCEVLILLHYALNPTFQIYPLTWLAAMAIGGGFVYIIQSVKYLFQGEKMLDIKLTQSWPLFIFCKIASLATASYIAGIFAIKFGIF